MRAALAALVFGEPRLAGILDDGELVLPGDGVDRIHVARHAEDVHRHDRARALGDAALDGRRVDRERRRVGVGEHRQRLAAEDRVVAGDEGVGRDDHLVAGVDVQDVQADHEGGGAAGGGQALLGAEQRARRRSRTPPRASPEPRYQRPLRKTLSTSGSQASRHCGHFAQPPVWTGVPPSRAGVSVLGGEDRGRAPAAGPRRERQRTGRGPDESTPAEELPHGTVPPLRRHFASGSGRSWKCTTLLVVPLPVSMWNGARVLTVVQRPRPFQPPFGSSMRPSIHFV